MFGCFRASLEQDVSEYREHEKYYLLTDSLLTANYRIKNLGFYGGFCKIIKGPSHILGRGANYFVLHSQIIRYYPSDSTLYMKGRLFDSEGRIWSWAQIFIGYISRDTCSEEESKPLVINDHYLINNDGSYRIICKIKKGDCLMFAPREFYDINGHCDGVDFMPIEAFNLNNFFALQ